MSLYNVFDELYTRGSYFLTAQLFSIISESHSLIFFAMNFVTEVILLLHPASIQCTSFLNFKFIQNLARVVQLFLKSPLPFYIKQNAIPGALIQVSPHVTPGPFDPVHALPDPSQIGIVTPRGVPGCLPNPTWVTWTKM